ncbi:SDR family NAD(P)-dependent oxidoreductase [Gymnodinialimonas hymeniacidonis]|uniref:SDR family NAD(P)-dependent oxidoreductase n=1 Tax=Gymnodinialimonas hymeniacidonis TaxID=3126508 RepID=UPI0034C65B52
MTAIVIGASAGLGRALSEALAKRGSDLILFASDLRDLNSLGAHLQLNYGVSVRTVSADATNIEAMQNALRDALHSGAPPTELYLPIGLSKSDDEILTDTDTTEVIWSVNYKCVVATIQTVLPLLSDGRDARIVGFGSIATIRGRSRNVAYAAAKRALSSYFESLRHDLSAQPVAVQFYQMGYIRTQQLHGHKSILPAIEPEHAAARILDHASQDFGTRFLPGYWAVIAPVLRHLPWMIFRRLKF